MHSRFSRPSLAALALAVGLAAIPACKKPKPTAPDTPATPTNPTPNPGGSTTAVTPPGDSSLPAAPKTPIFGAANPRVAAARSKADGNLKQIGLALHNYHSTYGTFPGGYADKTGKPGLSWRVAILPFIEQDALYKQFKLDEPWDSANNKPLIAQMPKLFYAGDQDTRGWTFARGFSGPNTWLPTTTGTAGKELKGAGLTQITDGLSNTILVADAAEPVIWTKPDEIAFDPKNPPKLGGVFEAGFFALMGDGSTKFLPKSLPPKTIADAIQINDGNIVDLPR